MAVPAKPNQADDVRKGPAEVVSMPRPEETSAVLEEQIAVELPTALPPASSAATEFDFARSGRSETHEMVEQWRDSANRMYEEARFRLTEAYEEAKRQTRLLGNRVQTRAAYMKREQPWQLLGIIAIASLAAGVAIRTWRSK